MSSDSKMLFRNFIHGYSGASPGRRQKRAEFENRGISDLLLEMEEVTAEKPVRKAEIDDDHYAYFARIPDAKCGGPEDSDRRIRCQRNRLWNAHSTLQSKPDSHPRAWHRASTEDLLENLLGSSCGAIPSADARRECSPSKDGSRRDLLRANTTGTQQPMNSERRTQEASESLRHLVFGSADNKMSRAKDGGPTYDRRCGTKEEVVQLHKVWKLMDEDGSGDVEFEEFLSFFNRNRSDRLLGMRCVNYLVGQAKSQGVDEQEVGCTIQDMMKLIWWEAGESDIRMMMFWFREAGVLIERVPTPPLLPKRKMRQILDNFPHIDWETCSSVPWHVLMDVSLVDPQVMREIRARFKAEPTTAVTKDDLLEMLCPNGYRPHAGATCAVDKNGEPIVFTTNEYFTGWVNSDSALVEGSDIE